MNNVYVKIQIELIETLPSFFTKLKAFIGEFRIEQQSVNEIATGVMTVSFWTDKVIIPEGESKQVDLEAMNLEDGSWQFTKINR